MSEKRKLLAFLCLPKRLVMTEKRLEHESPQEKGRQPQATLQPPYRPRVVAPLVHVVDDGADALTPSLAAELDQEGVVPGERTRANTSTPEAGASG